MIEIIGAALLIESTVEILKRVKQLKGKTIETSLTVGVLVCLLLKINILAIFSLTIPASSVTSYVSYILSGILLSRGSNFANNLIERSKK